MALVNQRWTLARFPVGLPTPSDFKLVTEEVRELEANEILLENRFISVDPGQRHFIEQANGLTSLGDTVPAWVVASVADSRSDSFPVGSFARDVMGQGGVQKYAIVPASVLVPVAATAPLSWYAGALGMSGQTGYFGLLDVGRPVAGETVLVSGTTGAVGSVAAQIARILKCRVVGLARGAEKTERLLSEFRLDAAIDLESEPLAAALTEKCPDGVDLFVDNVGGAILEEALLHMRFGGRIVSPGMMTLYNRTEGLPGLRNYEQMFARCLRWQGVSVAAYVDRYQEAAAQLEAWVRAGELVFDEYVEQGLERFPAMLDTLFRHRPVGKMILQVSGDPAES